MVPAAGCRERALLAIFNASIGNNFTLKSFSCQRVCVHLSSYLNGAVHQGKNIPLRASVCIYRKSYESHTPPLPKGILHCARKTIDKTWQPLSTFVVSPHFKDLSSLCGAPIVGNCVPTAAVPHFLTQISTVGSYWQIMKLTAYRDYKWQ